MQRDSPEEEYRGSYSVQTSFIGVYFQSHCGLCFCFLYIQNNTVNQLNNIATDHTCMQHSMVVQQTNFSINANMVNRAMPKGKIKRRLCLCCYILLGDPKAERTNETISTVNVYICYRNQVNTFTVVTRDVLHIWRTFTWWYKSIRQDSSVNGRPLRCG